MEKNEGGEGKKTLEKLSKSMINRFSKIGIYNEKDSVIKDFFHDTVKVIKLLEFGLFYFKEKQTSDININAAQKEHYN